MTARRLAPFATAALLILGAGCQSPEVPPPADWPDSLSAPIEVAASDGEHAFVYGAPAGDNNAEVRKLVISLPGHGSTAAQDYEAWRRHVEGGSWAVASVDWWDGGGETIENYLSPPEVVALVRDFLTEQGYDSDDMIVLEGFSRGSANTYAVMANDRLDGEPVFDAVISASGKYQDTFPLTATPLDPALEPTLYDGVPWVLACGWLDPEPDRDGCPGMHDTADWLGGHGADVLAVLEDPNAGHGAFHAGNLGLPGEALSLIEAALTA